LKILLLFTGINGVSKGLFVNGINYSLPMWVMVDIYGNSTAVEFIDSSDVHFRQTTSKNNKSTSPAPTVPVVQQQDNGI
jgi:hypothetical protein